MNSSKKENSNAAAAASQYGCAIQATSDSAGVPIRRLCLGDEPGPIAILKLDDHGELEPDSNALENILCHPDIRDKTVSIISMCGAFRKGKSFMLNHFLHYLRKEGWTHPNWIEDVAESLENGFKWRGGVEGCTEGILAWNEVYFVERSGCKVVIMLMDTHGLHDVEGDQSRSTIISALSIVMSSFQIFNVSQQIQGDDLNFLQLFAAYAEELALTKEKRPVAPFQTLMFLVRDWSNSQQIFYGIHEDSKKYLEKALSKCSDGKNSIKKHLKQCFSDIECCLLPHPGIKTSEAMETANLRGKITKKFTDQTAKFVASVLKPENIVTKKINGNEVKSYDIAQYLTSCFERYSEKKHVFGSQTILEVVVGERNFQAQLLCRDVYSDYMTKNTDDGFISDDALDDLHKEASALAMKEFNERTTFGGEDLRKMYRAGLKSFIEREHKAFITDNKRKNIEASLETLQIVYRLLQKYERRMRKVTAEKSVLKKSTLKRLHDSHCEVVMDELSENEKIHPLLKDEFLKRMKQETEQAYKNFFNENQEKNRLEKETMENYNREMLSFAMTLKTEFGRTLREMTEKYVVEETLLTRSSAEQKKMVDQLETKATEFEVPMSSSALKEHRESLKDMLKRELEQVKIRNEKNKKLLVEKLKEQRTKACTKYDVEIKIKLQQNCLKEEVLREKHEEVIKGLMENLKKDSGYDEDPPLVVLEHFVEAYKILNERFADTKKLNESNRRWPCSVL